MNSKNGNLPWLLCALFLSICLIAAYYSGFKRGYDSRQHEVDDARYRVICDLRKNSEVAAILFSPVTRNEQKVINDQVGIPPPQMFPGMECYYNKAEKCWEFKPYEKNDDGSVSVTFKTDGEIKYGKMFPTQTPISSKAEFCCHAGYEE